jgi:hypothetical protein
MSKRLHTIAMLSSCLMGCLLSACDAPGDTDVILDAEADVAEAESALSDGTKALHPSDQLAREWVRWALEQPYTTGPVSDPTGEQCGMGQDGPVWFLAGTYGGAVTRECTIPAGKELFFPLLNRWCTYPTEFFPTKESIDAVEADVLAWYEDSRQHTCTLTLRVDGQDVFAGGFDEMFEELYVLVPNQFEVELNTEDHYMTPYGVAGGAMPATGDGHYARLKALSPGDHVLELGGSACDGDALWFETSAVYHLHVE